MKKFFLTLAGKLVLAAFLLLATGCSKYDRVEPAGAAVTAGVNRNNQYLQIRINGGEWVSLDGMAANNTKQQFVISSVTGDSWFNISWPGGRGYFRWTNFEDMNSRIAFSYYMPDNTYYISGFQTGLESFESSGGLLNITSIGKSGNLVNGSFVIGPAGHYDAGTGKHLGNVIIEGRFNLAMGKVS